MGRGGLRVGAGERGVTRAVAIWVVFCGLFSVFVGCKTCVEQAFEGDPVAGLVALLLIVPIFWLFSTVGAAFLNVLNVTGQVLHSQATESRTIQGRAPTRGRSGSAGARRSRRTQEEDVPLGAATGAVLGVSAARGEGSNPTSGEAAPRSTTGADDEATAREAPGGVGGTAEDFDGDVLP